MSYTSRGKGRGWGLKQNIATRLSACLVTSSVGYFDPVSVRAETWQLENWLQLWSVVVTVACVFHAGFKVADGVDSQSGGAKKDAEEREAERR